MFRALAVLLVASIWSFQVVSAELPPVPSDWRSEVFADHPLTGSLWNAASGTRATPAELAEAGAAADFVLLGEKHDNPDHHRLQAWMVEALAALGARPAVAFEMIDADQADALQDHLAARPRDAAGLGPAIGWKERGWPDWEIYEPVAAAALRAGLPVRAADVAQPLQRKVGREGLAALAERRVRTLGLDRDLPEALRADLRQELVESHCNMLPDEAIAPMAKVQRLRDAAMAESLVSAAKEGVGQAVLIAGNGHVRGDRGVPWYLRDRLAEPKVLTLAILEVREGETNWRSYMSVAHGDAPPAFDYVWFTPRVDNEDPCEKFADQFRN
ncbi:ChaN family lipoprotein [Ferruginivarius sediminum]|uniref:Haem-binding uptake Tiki superfamily ChaN domain-containing protein n=1 Tax=Ferruginivarius sediminum TaxID=2661937 RepID=A0A369TL32_9PROT|nr:ChaN family lipoprotein [Ferruginivarius sediminum]RDD63606.1 hypothetical protein DRB17_00005 [Ferruginivarius sediminum]